MTDAERRAAAKQLATDWQGRGDEKQETQTFWIALLQKVYGVTEPDKYYLKFGIIKVLRLILTLVTIY